MSGRFLEHDALAWNGGGGGAGARGGGGRQHASSGGGGGGFAGGNGRSHQPSFPKKRKNNGLEITFDPAACRYVSMLFDAR